MSQDYILGIDLHGTLLDERWEIKPHYRDDLIHAVARLKPVCAVYVCTGNDLTFIIKYIPQEIRAQFDGFILETGCVVSDGGREKFIIPESLASGMEELEKLLKERAFPEVKYFARRLMTISLFTKDERGGNDPAGFYHVVKSVVDELGFEELVTVTHSSVAVDIIPHGYNKFSGISHVAGGRKIIGIADSLNDRHLITGADYAFVPSNASEDLLDEVRSDGMQIKLLNRSRVIERGVVLQSASSHTGAVIDILDFIGERFGTGAP